MVRRPTDRRVTLSKAEFPKRYKVCSVTKVKNLPSRKGIKCLNFGDTRYGNYTTHKDPKRKANYIKRHKKGQNWKDPNTAGFWAKNLLWNKPTLAESIKHTEKVFNLKIKRK